MSTSLIPGLPVPGSVRELTYDAQALKLRGADWTMLYQRQ